MKQDSKILRVLGIFAINLIFFTACGEVSDTDKLYEESLTESISNNFSSEVRPSLQEVYDIANVDGGVCIVKYNGKEKELVVPREINGMPVIEIGEGAFYENEILESIVLPDTLEKIGPYAFLFCRNLKDISIPESVSWIGSDAFGERLARIPWLDEQTEDFVIVGNGILIEYNGSAYENVKIPEGVQMISSAFTGIHALRSVTLPDSLRIIGADAFNLCLDLQTIEFPENLERIEENAFMNCTCLQKIEFPKSLKSIGTFAFCGCESLYEVTFTEDSVQFSLDSFAYTPIYDTWSNEKQITWSCEKPAWLD